jgi:hypothetical protein
MQLDRIVGVLYNYLIQLIVSVLLPKSDNTQIRPDFQSTELCDVNGWRLASGRT